MGSVELLLNVLLRKMDFQNMQSEFQNMQIGVSKYAIIWRRLSKYEKLVSKLAKSLLKIVFGLQVSKIICTFVAPITSKLWSDSRV